MLAWWLASGLGTSSVRVGPLPRLQEVADAAARRPAYVVVLADRHGTDLVVHAAGDQVPAQRLEVGERPGTQHDPHPDRPPAQLHGERHLTDREPESGGQRNAEFIAARVAGSTAPLGELIALLMVVQIAAGIPLSVGGWGPREGIAAWAFAAAGLGDWRYQLLPVPPAVFAETVAALPGCGHRQ